MNEKNTAKGRAAIALALCFCVVALTSFLAVKTSIDKISKYSPATNESGTPTASNQQAAAQTPVVDSQSGQSMESTESNPSEPAKTPEKYICPLDGPVIMKYSMDSLIYSKTLDQYMTHPGVDIRAELSSNVIAIADGTVNKVYNDDRYGMTVCITHDDGIVSIYSNLAQQGLAETGDEVKQGQVIGCVGDTALFESLDETHLHFEMRKDGNCTDPGNFVKSLAQ